MVLLAGVVMMLGGMKYYEELPTNMPDMATSSNTNVLRYLCSLDYTGLVWFMAWLSPMAYGADRDSL